jgi:hypothetical protein
MAKAEIFAGICGFNTLVKATKNGEIITLDIQSECQAIQKLSANLKEVDPYDEMSFRRSMPATHQAAHQYCTHAACPVPAGILKAVEVEAGLALPKDVTIKVSRD